jgi:hypothetical protein
MKTRLSAIVSEVTPSGETLILVQTHEFRRSIHGQRSEDKDTATIQDMAMMRMNEAGNDQPCPHP